MKRKAYTAKTLSGAQAYVRMLLKQRTHSQALLEGIAANERAMSLLMRALRSGVAAFDPATGEFRFNGMRYSAHAGDWVVLVGIIGRSRIEEAIARADGRES